MRCKGGMMGWIFGHKFTKHVGRLADDGGTLYTYTHCLRCGVKAGIS